MTRKWCRVARATVIATAVLALASTASAGVNRWTRVGPEGGAPVVVAAHPFNSRIAYAGSPDGLYITEDGGATWSRLQNQGLGGAIKNLVVDRDQPDTIYAQLGIGWFEPWQKSVDGGATWEYLLAPDGSRIGVLKPLGSPLRLYAVTSSSELFESTDAGTTWTRVGAVPWEPSDIAATSSGLSTVYAAYGRGGLRRTDDGGATWTSCGETMALEVDQVVVHPTRPETVYAVGNRYLSVSTDGCTTFVDRFMPGLWSNRPIVFHPTDPETMYTVTDRVVVSHDAGRSWATLDLDIDVTWAYHVAVSPSYPRRVWFSGAHTSFSEYGVFTNPDGGEHWTFSNRGMQLLKGSDLVVASPESGLVYAGLTVSGSMSRGVFSSTDDGASWDLLPGSEDLGSVLGVHPGSPAVIYAATAAGGISLSVDGGQTWELSLDRSSYDRFNCLEVATPDGLTAIAVAPYGDVYRTTDRGRTWQELSPADGPEPHCVVASPWTEGELWAATYDGILRSEDVAESWSPRSVGLEYPGGPDPFHPSEHFAITGLAFDPFDPENMIAWRCGGAYLSHDGGESWQVARDGLKICSELDGIEPLECFDQTKTSRGLRCSGGPLSVAYDRETPGLVYATTVFGPYRSMDGGRSWQPIGLGTVQVGGVTIVTLPGRRLLATSSTAGVLAMTVVDQVDPDPTLPVVDR